MPDAWKIELELANKDELAAIGKAKRRETEGRPRKETVVNNDNSIPTTTKPPPSPTAKPEKHNTRKEIAHSAGASTGKGGLDRTDPLMPKVAAFCRTHEKRGGFRIQPFACVAFTQKTQLSKPAFSYFFHTTKKSTSQK